MVECEGVVMSNPTTDEILVFMKDFKTRKELEEKFTLSNTQSFRIINWLKKGKYVEEVCMRVSGHTNRVWFYKAL
jgi:hypothetical protein